MSSRLLRALLGPLALAVLTSASLAAPDTALLTFTADGSDPAASFDLGDVSQADQPQITHTFTLRNGGTRPLTIVRLQPSCECTSISLAPQEDLPKTVAPGGEVSVSVSVTVESYFNGQLHQFGQVFVDGQDSAAATLKLTATMHPIVTTDPLALDFGTVPSGVTQSQTVTATIDARLAPASGAPTLTATDPDIQITPLGPQPAPSASTRAYAYRVTLAANAALGSVNDLLQFARGGTSVDGMALSDGPGITVTGTVIGSATADPDAAAFGIVTEGHAKILPIRLSATAPGILDTAQALAATPLLRCIWKRGTARLRVLDIILAPSASAGPVHSTVTVTLGNGQRFRLSVTGYVSAT